MDQGFLVVSESDSHNIKFFDNGLSQLWEVNLGSVKFSREDLKFHITESGNTIYVHTTGQDNSNFIKSITSKGEVSELEKIKFSVQNSFCFGEELIIEVYKEVNGSSFTGYLTKNEPVTYLKFQPNLTFEKFKLQIPVIKHKGEKTNSRKFIKGASSVGFYLQQEPELKDDMVTIKFIQLNYDESYKEIRIPFKVNSQNVGKKRIGVAHARTSYVLPLPELFIDESENKIFLYLGFTSSFRISEHNMNGGLLFKKGAVLNGLPETYKKWNSSVQMVDGKYVILNLLFMMDNGNLELFSYSMNFDGTNYKESKIGFNWSDPNAICYGKLDIPKQLNIINLSEFGALSYLQEVFEIENDNYGNYLEGCRFLKRSEKEILFIPNKNKMDILLFEKK